MRFLVGMDSINPPLITGDGGGRINRCEEIASYTIALRLKLSIANPAKVLQAKKRAVEAKMIGHAAVVAA